MYAFLKGIVEQINNDSIEIDVNGVGYLVYCDLYTLSGMAAGKAAKVYTALQTTQDGSMTLYGFANKKGKSMFELLITVSGIGAKGAVKILSRMKPDDIALAVATENEPAFKGAASPKIASRIIIDLKKKVGDLDMSGIAISGEVGGTSVIQEAGEALVGLGFSQSEAMNCVKAVCKQGMSVEDIIFLALKQGK